MRLLTQLTLLAICFMIAVDVGVISLFIRDQTALLQQIVANTKTPVAVQVSGFSPEAQKVFKKALEKGNKK